MNEDGNFRNVENVRNVGNDKNVRNVMTDIKCLTFSETQAQAGLNDDGNFRNGGYFKNVGNVRNAENRTECLNYDGRSNYLILEGLRLASSNPLLLVLS